MVQFYLQVSLVDISNKSIVYPKNETVGTRNSIYALSHVHPENKTKTTLTEKMLRLKARSAFTYF
jgi:hypothetical protein